jgi:hypothetical protein
VPALVLFGSDGAERFAAAEGAPAPASTVLRDGGLVVVRRGGVRALFDVGRLGYLRIAAHGHADALSLVVSEGSQELVSDPGTGTYFGSGERRRALRGTAAHATVSLGGDQADYGGPFLWLRHPHVRLLHVDLEDGVAVGEVELRRGGRLRHRRAAVVLSGGEVVVYDRIDGDAPADSFLTWPFHPALQLAARHERLVEASIGGRARLLLAVATAAGDGDPGLAVTITEGEWSRRLERVEPAAVARIQLGGRQEFVTLLVPARGEHVDDPRLGLTHEGAGSVASFTLGGSRRVRFSLGSDPVGVTVPAA